MVTGLLDAAFLLSTLQALVSFLCGFFGKQQLRQSTEKLKHYGRFRRWTCRPAVGEAPPTSRR